MSLVEIDYHELRALTPGAVEKLRAAFVGKQAFGAIAVINIPEYHERLNKAFRAGIDLALLDGEGRKRAAAVNNTYPGWSGTPGSETHPLQSSFLFNTKQEIPGGKPDPYFGVNIFPSEEYRQTWVNLATPMHSAALDVLRGCDVVIEDELTRRGMKWSEAGRSLHKIGDQGPALASRFICYDSEFTREDKLLEHRGEGATECQACEASAEAAASTANKQAGHAGDGLASMRTHSTPIKTAGHAGDGLASMRTHSTPIKTAGHAGDGLASMRTHSTPVKTAGHAGDGLASMRTHSTPVKTAGHAGDGLASMRTHSTPVKTAGHAGDGLASMRTHSTPVKTAGHAGDGLASMRTHSTPVKSAGHAGDGLASMRTHSTPVKSAGKISEASTTSSSSSPRPMSSSTSSSTTTTMHARAHSTQSMAATTSTSSEPLGPLPVPDVATAAPADSVAEAAAKETGDYWLPWHIDSNFITILHRERYAKEDTAELVEEPEGAGLLVMNVAGDVARMKPNPGAMVVQMGAFGQIYSGGVINSARHAVVSPRPPGIARFNFCNFWYVPWHTLCDAPVGTEHEAVTTGWNAMMDHTYLDITMKQGFAAFRQFMTTPEARIQFADSVHFKELAEMFPLPPKRVGLRSEMPEIVVDVLTDVRCPFSFLSQLNMDTALKNLGLHENAVLRYHPVFLNPNVSKEGESLDDYLLRDYGYSKEYAHSEEYPLRVKGKEAGVLLNPNRRVVNTFDAFVLISAAAEVGKQHDALKALSRVYFEEAKDISKIEVLAEVARELGLAEEASDLIFDQSRRARVWEEYERLAETVGEVPHFVLRERVSGNGVEVGGLKSVEQWEESLQTVLSKAAFIGMTIPGPYGQDIRIQEGIPYSPISLAIPAQQGYVPEQWPFTAGDFSRIDESPDTSMYAEPRLVNHLDESSLWRLTEAYRSIFSSVPKGFSVLDLCSSWVSHYPEESLEGARVVVHGLNQRELWANQQATERHVQDLNADAKLPWDDNSFDFVTMALSIQYMTDPRAVFSEMNRVLKPGGMAVIAHSHRCFIEKAVKAFATETYDGEGHTHTICRYFQFGPQGGWEKISSVDVSPQHSDPMWLVTAVKAK